jgi:hypothetical protein
LWTGGDGFNPAALALSTGAIDSHVFSVLIFTAFLLNLFTPVALKGCSVFLKRRPAIAESTDASSRYEHRYKS